MCVCEVREWISTVAACSGECGGHLSLTSVMSILNRGIGFPLLLEEGKREPRRVWTSAIYTLNHRSHRCGSVSESQCF